MSENTTNKNVRDDEIDLLDLFRRIGRTFSRWGHSLGRAFLITTVFLLRRWLPLGLSLVAGIGASYLLKTITVSFYSSDMILRNNAVTTSEIISYVNRLHIFCLDGNFAALSKALSIKPESVNNILDISPFWVIDQRNDGIPDFVDYKNSHNVYDTVDVRMRDRMDIRVKIKSPQDLGLMGTAIVTFINNDSLFQQRNRVRLRQNRELITRLNYDILQLDSLQKIKYFVETKSRQPQTGGQIIFLQEQKTQLVYTDIYSLYDRKQGLESDRDLYKGIVTVLSDFTLPAKRDNGGLYYGKKIIPFFFCFTLLLLILQTHRKKLLETYRKY